MTDLHKDARVWTLLLVSTLTVMSGATIAPGLPGLQAHFEGTPHAELLTRFVLTVPALAIALLAPFAGAVVDRFGRRPTILAGVVLYALFGTAGVALDHLGLLIASRALLGAAVAFLMTTAVTLAGDYFAGQERAKFLGYQAAFMGMGGLVFLNAGGLLAEWSWRGPFLVYALALLLLPAVKAFLPEPERPSAGAGVDEGGLSDLAGPARVALAAVMAIGLFSMAVFYLVPVQLPFLIAHLDAGGPAASGLAIGLFPSVSALSSLFLFAPARKALGAGGVFALGLALIGVGYAMIAAASGLALIMTALVVAGLGLGFIMPNVSTTALSLAPLRARGRVSGLATSALFAGQFVSPLFSQPAVGVLGLSATYAAAAILLAIVSPACLLLNNVCRQAAARPA